MKHLSLILAKPFVKFVLSLLCILALALPQVVPGLVGHFLPNLLPHAAHADSPNPIQVENSKPGDPTWNDFNAPLQPDIISGYGSKISVNHGQTIDFYVTTTSASVSIDIYRTGYYGGAGARKITSLGSFPGVHQPMPTPDPVTGMIACNWTKTASLTIPSDWVTGVYLAKLTASGGDQSFIFFVVRNDGGHEDLVFQTSVTTYQAYNTWGGTSLYNNNTNGQIFSGPHATKVSFNRPFNPGDSNGAGHYFFYEYKFVYWLESQGYNVTYTTDVDTDTNVNPLTNHKAFLAVGHDEYWSKGMRDNVQNAINAGVNVAFFTGNAVFWQIRFEPDAAGNPDRVEVGYKDFATDTTPPGPDPEWGVNNAIVTTNWRSDPVDLPENALMGVMYEEQVDQSYPFVVQNSSHWVYAGTGLSDGSSIPGIVGYEYDRVFDNGSSPSGLTILGNSPLTACCNFGNSHANATIYTAPSGARVFAAGTIQWSWGLANIQGNTFASAGIQKITSNILNTFITGQLPGVNLYPGSLNFGNQSVNTTSSPLAVKLTNNSAAATTISNIAFTGANAGDFSQTNNCPATLAVNTSCTISVTFHPTSTSSSSATLAVSDNAANSPQSIPISGTGIIPAPGITLSPSNIAFGGQGLNVTSPQQAVTLTNNGTLPLAISSIALSGANASAFHQTNNCPLSPSTLAVNASCTIDVTFTPSAVGDQSASVTINDNAPNSPHSVALSGTGVTPAVYFSDGFESGNFSTWNLNSSDSSGTRTVQSGVVNSGTSAAAFTNASGQYSYLATSLANAQALTYTRFYFRIASGTGGTTLAIARNASGQNVWEVDYDINHHGLDIYFWNGARTLFSLFSPQNAISADTWYCLELQMNEATGGQAQAWLNGTSIGTVSNDLSIAQPYQNLILYDSAPGTIYFDDVVVASTYNGPVVLAPHASLSPNSVSFGSQGTHVASAPQQVSLTNSGNTPLSINSIALNGTNAGDFSQTNNCPARLAVGATCTINVTFTPSTTGNRSANLVLTDSASDSPQTVALSGTGVPPAPAVSLSPPSLSFGTQNLNTTSAAQTITLTNSGSAPLTLTNITLNGTNAGDYHETNNCPASLAIHSSCTLSVTFTPSANGSRSASITLNDNAANSPQSIALSGTGVTPAPAVSLSPANLTFGNQNVGFTSGAHSMTLTNSGTAPLTITALNLGGPNAGDYNETNNCPGVLAAGASCVISVTFTPAAAGPRSASITLSDDAANSPQTVALSGTGFVAQVYFSDGFESGNLNSWNINSSDSSGTRTVQSSVVNSGSYAAAFTNTSGQYSYLATTLSAGPQTLSYTRLAFRVASGTGGTELVIGLNQSGQDVLEVDYNANRAGLDIYIWNGARTLYTIFSVNGAISPDTWYSLEIEMNEVSAGHAEAWLNGSSIGAIDNDLSTSSPYSELMLFDSAPGTIYFDDIAVTNNYNGPAGNTGLASLATPAKTQLATALTPARANTASGDSGPSRQVLTWLVWSGYWRRGSMG